MRSSLTGPGTVRGAMAATDDRRPATGTEGLEQRVAERPRRGCSSRWRARTCGSTSASRPRAASMRRRTTSRAAGGDRATRRGRLRGSHHRERAALRVRDPWDVAVRLVRGGGADRGLAAGGAPAWPRRAAGPARQLAHAHAHGAGDARLVQEAGARRMRARNTNWRPASRRMEAVARAEGAAAVEVVSAKVWKGPPPRGLPWRTIGTLRRRPSGGRSGARCGRPARPAAAPAACLRRAPSASGSRWPRSGRRWPARARRAGAGARPWRAPSRGRSRRSGCGCPCGRWRPAPWRRSRASSRTSASAIGLPSALISRPRTPTLR